MKINEYMSVRFNTSNGCILCGKMGIWRIKVLDPKNRQHFVCLDCLSGLKELEVKDVSKKEDTGREGKTDKGTGKETTKSERKEQPSGDKSEEDVE